MVKVASPYKEQSEKGYDMKVEVKMSKRLALRLLKEKDCRVRLHGMVGDVNKIYTTDHTWFESDSDVIFIKEQRMCQDFEYITHIEYTDRFGTTSFMGVDWE